MSEPTQLYRLTRELTVEEWRIFLDLIADPGPPSFMPVLVPVEPDSYMMACWETGTIEPMKHCTDLYMSGPKLKPGHQQCERIAVFKAGIGGDDEVQD